MLALSIGSRVGARFHNGRISLRLNNLAATRHAIGSGMSSAHCLPEGSYEHPLWPFGTVASTGGSGVVCERVKAPDAASLGGIRPSRERPIPPAPESEQPLPACRPRT